MAIEKRKSGLLYLLCLSRYTLRKLYEFHLQDEFSRDVDNTYLLFGAEPYTFADGHHHSEPAPVREFGVLKTSLAKRKKIYEELPDGYKQIIQKSRDTRIPFGPFIDEKGRYYKFEEERLLTALKPVGCRFELEFPYESENIIITHVHDRAIRFSFAVMEVGLERGNTCHVYVANFE